MRLDFISLFERELRASFAPLILQAVLKKSHHDSSIIFLVRTNDRRYWKAPLAIPTDEEIDLVLDKLKTLKTDVVGLSLASPLFFAAAKITRQIQKRLGIPVIWGGICPTIEPQKCIQFADFICVGEGEDAVAELAQCLSEGRSPDRIEGLWIRHGTTIIKNGPRAPVQDLDTLPTANFDNADCHYLCAEGTYDLRRLGSRYLAMASRGCIFRCSYCGEASLRTCYGIKRNYRVRSPENIVEELKEAARLRPINTIIFQDALFPFYPDWIKRFSSLYKKEIGIPFHIRFHPAFIRPRELGLLRDAGVASLNISLESASERVRQQVFHRPMTDAQYLHMHKLVCATKGLGLICNLIADNPFEEQSDKDAAVDFLMKLPGRFHLAAFTLIFHPGTEITALALKKGMITNYHVRWALKPYAFEINFAYKRTKAQKHWLATIMLFCVYFEFRCLPKKLIYAISKSGFLKRHPQLLFITAFVLYKAGRKIRLMMQKFTLVK